jgi:2'-hydroxyisoflavone reductase
MKLLILGGTRFVGRHLVSAALARSHEVTLFNRGKHSSTQLELTGIETIHGDRNTDLDKLSGRQWDAVIDTCGYLPRAVKASAAALADSACYVFISSLSVYADLSHAGVDESAPLATLTGQQLDEANAIDASGESSAATYGKLYGGLKASCEQEVCKAFPDSHLIVRPGLIVGPYDYTDRFTYWVERVAEGGEVLAPGRRERSLQFIDARDLSEWIVQMVERKQTGVYNANAKVGSLTMENLLDECRATSNSDARVTWVSEDFLLEHQVAAWTELPLYLPEHAAPHLKGFMFVNSEKAIAAGLKFRPLSETIADTLAWRRTVTDEPLQAGLDRDRENSLLLKWRERHNA